MLYLFSHSISKTLLRPKTIRPPEMTTPYLSGNLARLFSIAPSRLHRATHATDGHLLYTVCHMYLTLACYSYHNPCGCSEGSRTLAF